MGVSAAALSLAVVIVAIALVAFYFFSFLSRAKHERMEGGRKAIPQSGPKGAPHLWGAMRRLWFDHVERTAFYILSALQDSPDADAAATYLHKNQDAIGAAIVPFFGPAAGQRLAALLHEHIDLAARLVGAAKQGAPLDDAMQAWERNADEISDFLADANPAWDRAATRAMMRRHLKLTTAFLRARLLGQWELSFAQHSLVIDQAQHMADFLTQGIAARRAAAKPRPWGLGADQQSSSAPPALSLGIPMKRPVKEGLPGVWRAAHAKPCGCGQVCRCPPSCDCWRGSGDCSRSRDAFGQKQGQWAGCPPHPNAKADPNASAEARTLSTLGVPWLYDDPTWPASAWRQRRLVEDGFRACPDDPGEPGAPDESRIVERGDAIAAAIEAGVLSVARGGEE